jgi:hypothetical protein
MNYILNKNNKQMLLVDNYGFNHYRNNIDGSISFRCKYYQTKGINCKTSCTIVRLPNGSEYFKRRPKAHYNHGSFIDFDETLKRETTKYEINEKTFNTRQNMSPPKLDEKQRDLLFNNQDIVTDETLPPFLRYVDHDLITTENSMFPKLESISGTSYVFIENCFVLHRKAIIQMIQYIRHPRINYYNDQQIDDKWNFVFNYSSSCYPILTTNDGDCLYHAVSISLFGDQSHTFCIKLCAAFIVNEYKDFFMNVLTTNCDAFTSLPNKIENMIRIGYSGDIISIIALNILTTRPIFSYGINEINSRYTNVSIEFPQDSPICIAFKENQFVALLGTPAAIIYIPKFNSTCFWKYVCPPIVYY